jgi:hypothetical protein
MTVANPGGLHELHDPHVSQGQEGRIRDDNRQPGNQDTVRGYLFRLLLKTLPRIITYVFTVVALFQYFPGSLAHLAC